MLSIFWSFFWQHSNIRKRNVFGAKIQMSYFWSFFRHCVVRNTLQVLLRTVCQKGNTLVN